MNTIFAGELLMRLECENCDRIEQVEHFRIRYTGAEANAAIAMSSLGAQNVYFVTAVPDNPVGRSALEGIRRFGPDTRFCVKRPGPGRLGLFFLETGFALRPSQCVYDRAGSVFSLTPFSGYDFDSMFAALPVPGWFHICGTLPALSPVCRELAFRMVKSAKEHGYTVSFDLNYRSALWSVDEAKKVFQQMMQYTDVLISNAGVAESFLETPLDDLCAKFGLTCAALTLRAETTASGTTFGGELIRADGSRVKSPMRSFPVLDRVGGGDAFAGGIIYALQQDGWTDERRIDFAAACGILKQMTHGDFSLSTEAEVEALVSGESCEIKR